MLVRQRPEAKLEGSPSPMSILKLPNLSRFSQHTSSSLVACPIAKLFYSMRICFIAGQRRIEVGWFHLFLCSGT